MKLALNRHKYIITINMMEYTAVISNHKINKSKIGYKIEMFDINSIYTIDAFKRINFLA